MNARQRTSRDIKIFVFYSDSYREILERYFLPSLQDSLPVCLCRNDLDKKFLSYKSFGWNKLMEAKVDHILSVLELNPGKRLIFSDPDVQFFYPIHKHISQELDEKDLVFQKNDQFGRVCAGFFACRSNQVTLQFWKEVRQHITFVDDDQDVVNSILGLNSHFSYFRCLISKVFKILSLNFSSRQSPESLRWGYLPPGFFTGENTRGEMWEPGDCIDIPGFPIVHHANWTQGRDYKIQQLDYVKELVNKRDSEGPRSET